MRNGARIADMNMQTWKQGHGAALRATGPVTLSESTKMAGWFRGMTMMIDVLPAVVRAAYGTSHLVGHVRFVTEMAIRSKRAELESLGSQSLESESYASHAKVWACLQAR